MLTARRAAGRIAARATRSQENAVVREIDAVHDLEPREIELPSIPVFQYQKSLQDEIDAGCVTRATCLELLEQMVMIRYFEEMIAEIRAGAYRPLPRYNYIGPTHISVGQEATSAGAVGGIAPTDGITSSHRGHGDAVAKGYRAIKGMDDAALRARLEHHGRMLEYLECTPSDGATRAELEEAALRLHVYRMIAELFGKSDGYCRGVGGSMHIADFESGHLGANAIVGGHMGIAAGAGISARYRESGEVVLCLAGDGAYQNGISHEAITLTTMAQFHNGLMRRSFGVPVIFAIVNNQYAMSGQSIGETTGLDSLARLGVGHHVDGLHAEVVDGMNVLAVRDATERAAARCREGHGPVMLEFMTYRFKGHSLSDPQAYRERDEVQTWMDRDPTRTFPEALTGATFPEEQGGAVTTADVKALSEQAWQRNGDMAQKAAGAEEPAPDTILLHMFRGGTDEPVPERYAHPTPVGDVPSFNRKEGGTLSYRLALREALVEEMIRDERVVLLGEDIAEYGGAFAVTQGLLDVFGRDRVFNTAIVESAIVGAGVGMAMTGLRPVCEIMYDDFLLMTMDQTGNQAAKWSYMSGGQMSVPMVIRTPHGGGRGYAGQHSQCLESICTHMPGLKVVIPSNGRDAKGLLKSAIRDPNPVIFFEHQQLYNEEAAVPEEGYLVPLGKAKVVRTGTDATVVAWGWPVLHALEAAERLAEDGVSVEVVDPRTLWPLDVEMIVESVKKTGRCLVVCQAVLQGSFTGEVVSQVVEQAFDYLDAPVLRLGAPNSVPPCAQSLEREFLVNPQKVESALRRLLA
jgi:2-oxoisovalerate dehydrogenase E1 component